MELIRTCERLPDKSGDYLTQFEIKPKTEIYYFQVLNYSAKHKIFNAFDDMQNVKHGLYPIAWAELPEPI